MRLKYHWHRFSYLLTKRLWQKEGKWEIGIPALRQLLHYLPLVTDQLPPERWKSVHLISQWRTVDGLLQYIQKATETIERCVDIVEPRTLMAEPSEYRLYDFFVTEQRLPLRLHEVVNTFCPTLTAFLNALEAVDVKDDIRAKYYRRRYFRLIEASYILAQILCDLATRE